MIRFSRSHLLGVSDSAVRFSVSELRSRSVFVGILVATIWAAGCAIQKSDSLGGSQGGLNRALVKEELSRGESSLRSVPSVSRSNYNFLLGELALKEERFDEALEYFEAAAEGEDGAAATLRKRLAQLYLRDGQLDEALEQIDLASQGEENEVELLQLRAGILATLKRTDEAIETYRKIIRLTDVENEEPYVFIASLYAQQNDVNAAEGILHELVQKNPKSFFGNYYLAKIYVTNTDFDKAEEYYKKALQLNPNAETVQIELARVYAYRKKFEKAIAICEEVVKNNPSNVKAHALLGELLLGKDRVDDALKQFEAVQDLEEDPSETRFKIALIKLQRRDLEGAEVELRLVLSQHPENSAARYYLASTYAGLKRADEAVEQLKQIEKGQDFYVEAKTLGSYLLRQEERYDEAIDMLQELVESNPEDAKILGFLAALYRDNEQFSKAVETTDKIIAIQPTEDRHYFNKGVYLDESGDREGAMVAMRKALELNAENANALNYLGYTLAELSKDLNEAEELVKKAIALEPDNGYFIDSLGWIYFQMGRYEDALRELQRAAKLVPDDAVILEHLGRAYLQVGKADDARLVLKEALEHAPDSDDEKAFERISVELQKLGPAPDESK